MPEEQGLPTIWACFPRWRPEPGAGSETQECPAPRSSPGVKRDHQIFFVNDPYCTTRTVGCYCSYREHFKKMKWVWYPTILMLLCPGKFCFIMCPPNTLKCSREDFTVHDNVHLEFYDCWSHGWGNCSKCGLYPIQTYLEKDAAEKRKVALCFCGEESLVRWGKRKVGEAEEVSSYYCCSVAMSMEDIQVMWTWPVHRFSEVNTEGKWQQGTKLSSMMSLAWLTWECFIQLCCGKQLVSAAEWADASDLKKLQLNNFRVVDMEDFKRVHTFQLQQLHCLIWGEQKDLDWCLQVVSCWFCK